MLLLRLLLLLVLLLLLRRACWYAIILQSWHVGSVVAVVSGEVRLSVRASSALVGGVVVRTADLTEWSSAGVGPATKHG